MFVAVLYGENTGVLSKDEEDGLSEVSIVSQSLANLGFTPVNVPFHLDILKTKSLLDEFCPLFVFNLVEAIEGKGGLIHLAPSMLDYFGIPYTGSQKDAVFLTSNKLLAKKFLKSSGILTPPYHTMDEIIRGQVNFDPPYILKSVWEHASIGIDDNSIIYDKEELREEIQKRYFLTGSDYFVEAYIEGREFNIALLADEDGPQVLPHAEIDFKNYPPGKPRIVDYSAKWVEDSFEYMNTSRKFGFSKKDSLLLKRLSNISVNCWDLFKLNGYARVDFRVDKKGVPWVLEVNINPCLSPESGFIAAAIKAGLDFDTVVKRIIKDLFRCMENRLNVKAYDNILKG